MERVLLSECECIDVRCFQYNPVLKVENINTVDIGYSDNAGGIDITAKLSL